MTDDSVLYTDEEGDGVNNKSDTHASSVAPMASVTPYVSLTSDARLTPASTLTSFAAQQTNEVKNFGVKEGNSHKYDSEDINFAYCNHPINLYRIDENDNVLYFDDFIKPSQHYAPRSGFGLLDHQIIENLSKQDIGLMRPIQIAALQAVFFQNAATQKRSSDFLGVSATGSGKTHAFLVPVIQKCLTHFQESPFNAKLTPFALIFAHSTTLVESIYQKVMELVKDTGLIVRMIAGKTEFLLDTYFNIGICSIGRFANHVYPDLPGVKINLKALKYVVIDEADKMVLLDEFLPLYCKLKEKAIFTTMLFSATNNSSVKDFIDAENHFAFYCGTPNTVATSVRQKFWHINSRSLSRVFGVFREATIVEPYEAGEKPHPFDAIYCMLCRDIKKNELDIRVLIFVKRTALADFVAHRLTLCGIPAVSVHSGQMPEDRQRFLQYFIRGEVQVMVATNLLTRGTDIQVDYVINYDLPVEYSEYIHRCGRTGRNQQKGVAITCIDFDNHDDYNPAVLQQIVLNTKKLPSFMLEFAENTRKIRELEMIEKQDVADKS